MPPIMQVTTQCPQQLEHLISARPTACKCKFAAGGVSAATKMAVAAAVISMWPETNNVSGIDSYNSCMLALYLR